MRNFKLFCILVSFWAGAAHAQETPVIANEIQMQVKPVTIVANELKEIGLWGLGIDQKDFDPIDSDLWADARAENLGVLFDKVSATTKFVPLNMLVQRVLFSGGTAPNASPEIARKRLLAAAKIGDAEKVAQLLSMVPQITQSQYLTAHYADSLFAQGKNDEACALISDSKPETPVRIILELRAVCYALNDESAAAQLSLDLASVGQAKSSNDQWLARAIIGLPMIQTATSLKFRADNGHFLAISKQLKLNLDAVATQNIGPLNVLNFARHPTTIQTEAQKIAAKSGILSISEYRQLSSDNVTVASAAIDVNLSQSGDINIVSFDGEDFVAELKSVSDIDDWWVIAKRIGPKLKEIQNPNPKSAEILIDAALSNFDIESARRFMALVGQPPPYRNIIMAIIDNKLASIIIRDTLAGTFNQNYSKAKVIADLSMLWALDIANTGQEEWLEISSAGGTSLPQNTMNALDSAVKRGSKAEIVLNASLAVRSIDAKAVDLSQMARIVSAIKGGGFETEAKELAVYSILARRLDFNRKNEAQPNQPRPNNLPQAAKASEVSPDPSARQPSAPAPVSARPKANPPRPASNIPDWRAKID